jgi:hypothetical protein
MAKFIRATKSNRVRRLLLRVAQCPWMGNPLEAGHGLVMTWLSRFLDDSRDKGKCRMDKHDYTPLFDIHLCHHLMLFIA